jgi:hypothetical protein
MTNEYNIYEFVSEGKRIYVRMTPTTMTRGYSRLSNLPTT